jgi:hypothetical protein
VLPFLDELILVLNFPLTKPNVPLHKMIANICLPIDSFVKNLFMQRIFTILISSFLESPQAHKSTTSGIKKLEPQDQELLTLSTM